MNYYNDIKNKLINNEINKRVKNYSINRGDLNTYYKVGKILSEAGKHYGEGIIKEYSRRLTNELGKGYTQSRLRYFRRFYYIFSKCPTLSDKLSFSHYCELIWNDDFNKISYYINISVNQNLSVRQLRERIKLNEYERLSIETRNKLINKDENNIIDFIKNPIIIRNNKTFEILSEKVLQKIILEDIEFFMTELGNSFSFLGSEYKIRIGNVYNYIDLLLYNIEHNCYVVIELKVTELKKEHIGQKQVYMNYIDDNLKSINQNKTIGIIICKEDNEYIIKYCSDERIITRKYELKNIT